MESKLKAIVIGAGIAGLASAIRLSIQGFSVTVYERSEYPGGKLNAFKVDGFHFDTGPSLLTQPENIIELFQLAGEKIEDYFNYTTVPVACNYFYEDGSKLIAYTNAAKFAEELHDKFGEDIDAVIAYLQRSAKLYNNVGTLFINKPLHQTRSFFSAPVINAIRTIKWKYIFNSLDRLNRSSFKNPHSVQLFNRYATYNGSNPYEAPGLLSLISHLEYNEGVFYPQGGMISITTAMYKLALKKGVQFQFKTNVQRIIYYDEKVRGVVVNNKNLFTDIVVSNMDIYLSYVQLLNDQLASEKILRQERSSSALVFYWGIGKTFPELQLHNIFFSKNYKAEFDHIFHYKKIYDDPTVYINVTSKREATHAPQGKENWFVMINVPANTGQDWTDYVSQSRKYIISKLNRMLQTEIEPLIEEESILDPVTIESKTAAYMGSIYGAASNTAISAFLRHPNFSKRIRGLYFAGGSVHPGGGIPLCLRSAKIVSDLVATDMKKRHGKNH